ALRPQVIPTDRASRVPRASPELGFPSCEFRQRRPGEVVKEALLPASTGQQHLRRPDRSTKPPDRDAAAYRESEPLQRVDLTRRAAPTAERESCGSASPRAA